MEELPVEPRGLYLQPDFITPAHEAKLLHIFRHELTWPVSKNPGAARLSLHYGYTFDYKTFGIDPDIPYKPFPSWLEPLIPMSEERPPDQVCLQWYPPGAGIPPHVDTHSAYDQLYALSLGSAVCMQFRTTIEQPLEDDDAEAPGIGEVKDGEAKTQRRQVEIDLPPRSMMQMTGDSRLHWEHGIKKRKKDVLPDGTVRMREERWSITYRWLRGGGVCECGNARLCDTAQARLGVERELRWKTQGKINGIEAEGEGGKCEDGDQGDGKNGTVVVSKEEEESSNIPLPRCSCPSSSNVYVWGLVYEMVLCQYRSVVLLCVLDLEVVDAKSQACVRASDDHGSSTYLLNK
ncbi:hypothetical protein F5Y18DRAFT_378436 [Xylariaceae sp. FL1019]|nr:hypothetical protein F5Y18DRAFT_378436 [Xylariaceae sp. FL1019]